VRRSRQRDTRGTSSPRVLGNDARIGVVVDEQRIVPRRIAFDEQQLGPVTVPDDGERSGAVGVALAAQRAALAVARRRRLPIFSSPCPSNLVSVVLTAR
jgi:hypothetical protein